MGKVYPIIYLSYRLMKQRKLQEQTTKIFTTTLSIIMSTKEKVDKPQPLKQKKE